MDIEYVKIEPPNVVKEELEIDQSENFEMKLENEEKSQTMGEDFIFGEKKPSTSIIVEENLDIIMIENHQTIYSMIVCTCCEKLKASHELIEISQQYLKNWRHILREDFYKRALSQKPAYICRSLFDVERQEHNHKVLLAKKDKDMRENAVVFSDDNIERSMLEEKKTTCGYCEKLKYLHEMTLSPSNPNTLRQWGDILGDEFYKKASSRKVTYICRSHFKVPWKHRRPHNLFPCVEPVLKKVKKEVPISEPVCSITFFEDNLYTCCCCCGERKEVEEMVKTPGTVEELLEWYQILGEKFYKNASNSKSSMVCRSHFDIAYLSKNISTYQRKNRTTQPVRNVKKMNKNVMLSCAYCGKTKPYRFLTTVPQDALVLKKWGDVLGEEFYERARGNGITSICRSHFNVGWGQIRPNGLLPYVESVRESLHQVKCTVMESPLTEINSASLSIEVKLEEHDKDEILDEKPLNLLNEAQSEDFDLEIKFEKNLEIQSADEQTNQDGSSNTKRIKLEV